MSETKDIPAEAETLEQEAATSPFYGKAVDLLAHYNHCNLCGSNLHFTHNADFNRNMILETARCPECGVKARQIQHKLQ